jgi:S-adenosylmethionine hydrolase
MIVTLLTDYGYEDEFVGVCHGVIRSICADCDVIDLGHGVPRHDIRRGALVLRNALPYVPPGVHVAVVDPEVGSERRAVAVRSQDDRLLVGPDNGLLSLAWERFGGAVEAVDISRSPYRLEPVSATFHGRDLFAAVAAHLAGGADLRDAGDRVDVDELNRLELPHARVADGVVVTHALIVDRFGNVGLDADHETLAGSGLTLGGAVEVESRGARHEARFVRSFADVEPGAMLLYEDAYRTLALAVNRGSAAETLGVLGDDEVRLSPR